jgi:replicative DNA helicase
MTERDKLITQFLDAPRDTPQAIVDAVNQRLSAGAWGKIADYIMDYCHERDIQGDEFAFIEQETARGKAREERERKKQAVRTLIQRTERFQEGLNDERIPLNDQKLMEAEAELGELAASLGTTSDHENRVGTWDEYLHDCVTYEPEKDFRPSLFAGLPFPMGTLSYIGARAKVGKTTAMINLAREALFGDNPRRIFFITLEMSRKQLLTKLILSTTFHLARGTPAQDNLRYQGSVERKKMTGRTPQRDFYDLMKGKLLDKDTGTKEFIIYVNKAKEKVQNAYGKTLAIYDGRGADFNEIIAALKTSAEAGDVILLDYIQRMPTPPDTMSDTYMRVKSISDRVLTAAAETNAIIISGAQFNRTVTKNAQGEEIIEPTSFRESGDLEQDAHNSVGIGKLAGMGERYIKMLAAREELVEDDAYLLDFEGGFSYMALLEKIKAPEPLRGRSKSKSKRAEPVQDGYVIED